MDTTTIVIIVILLIAIGIFVGVQIGGGSTTGNSIKNSNSYPTQYSGGGCGR